MQRLKQACADCNVKHPDYTLWQFNRLVRWIRKTLTPYVNSNDHPRLRENLSIGYSELVILNITKIGGRQTFN